MNYRRSTIIIAISIVMCIIIISGCVEKRGEVIEDKYSDNLILGKTEDVYLAGISSLLVKIYSESNVNNRKKLREQSLQYMTDEIADIMTRGNEGDGAIIKDGRCTVTRIDFGYGRHQEDGKNKVLAQLHIEFEDGERYVTLEMRLDDKDKIYEFIVW